MMQTCDKEPGSCDGSYLKWDTKAAHFTKKLQRAVAVSQVILNPAQFGLITIRGSIFFRNNLQSSTIQHAYFNIL